MKPNPNTRSRGIPELAAHLVAAILLLTSGFPACAQPGQVSLTVRGHWPTDYPPTDALGQVRLAGNLAYVGTSGYPPYGTGAAWEWKPRLAVLDVTNPLKTVWVGYCDVDVPLAGWDWWPPAELRLAGRYAYQTYQKGELSIVDVSNPAQPVNVGGYTLGGFAFGLQVAGRHAYVASPTREGWGTLEVLDISDPENPTWAGWCATSAAAPRVIGDGPTAYVQVCRWEPPYAGLDVIDIGNPAAPLLLGACPTGDGHGALDVSNGYAYCCDFQGLWIIDVRNRSLPTVVGRLSRGVVGCQQAIKVAGRYAYMFGGCGPGEGDGFFIVDVSNPAQPAIIGRCTRPLDGSFGSIELSGAYAFCGDGSGNAVIDVSNPSAPKLVGRLMDEFGGRAFLNLWVEPGVAFAVEARRLTVMNVQDPAQPREMGRYTAAADGNLNDVHVQGGRALLAGNGFWELLDVATAAAPTLLHHQDTVATTSEWWNERCRIVGDRGYLQQRRYVPELGVYVGQIEIIDLTNPSAPLLLGVCTCNVWGYCDLAVMNSYVYLVDGENGLMVIDARDPTSPRMVSNLTGVNSSAIKVRANHAYVVRARVRDDESQPYRGQLRIVDVSDPLHPVTVGTWDTPAGIGLYGVDLVDRYALVASFPVDPPPESGGLEVTDVSDPAGPTWVGSYRGSIHRDNSSERAPFRVLGDHVYLNEWGGLTILEMSLPGVLKLEPPVLSANTLTLTWNGGPGIKLQRTASLTNPDWRDVPGSAGASQLELPRDTAAAFFRLIQP